ncbi:hypothetical protein [Bradyrhizobium sp. 151]|uniref:hypothetical protein n=1 Tax=Bradyrhizobium sp. 151 TaxID=2782626 RepID=UPI001FF853F4|nr:hypothetical protein [Bradyrhizobium sp. 151]MCK1663161.1 hypothetical protein [Bradyrhizobium sp. 151]
MLFYTIADSTDIKASEMHLAAAQIIGAALALVLSLSIIPAQRAAEYFLSLFCSSSLRIVLFSAFF